MEAGSALTARGDIPRNATLPASISIPARATLGYRVPAPDGEAQQGGADSWFGANPMVTGAIFSQAWRQDRVAPGSGVIPQIATIPFRPNLADSALRDLGGGTIQVYGALAIGGASLGNPTPRLDPAISSFVSDRSARPSEADLLARMPPARAIAEESRSGAWQAPIATADTITSTQDRLARIFDRPRHGERRISPYASRVADVESLMMPIREIT